MNVKSFEFFVFDMFILLVTSEEKCTELCSKNMTRGEPCEPSLSHQNEIIVDRRGFSNRRLPIHFVEDADDEWLLLKLSQVVRVNHERSCMRK
jgi:hypothetical protein